MYRFKKVGIYAAVAFVVFFLFTTLSRPPPP